MQVNIEHVGLTRMERRMLRQNRHMRKMLAILYLSIAIVLISGLLWFVYPQVQDIRSSAQAWRQAVPEYQAAFAPYSEVRKQAVSPVTLRPPDWQNGIPVPSNP